jgi:hypothetical protein
LCSLQTERQQKSCATLMVGPFSSRGDSLGVQKTTFSKTGLHMRMGLDRRVNKGTSKSKSTDNATHASDKKVVTCSR